MYSCPLYCLAYLLFQVLKINILFPEYCHTDPDDNFLVMLEGRKELRLFGLDTEHMYPNVFGSKGKTLQSQVNVEEPNLEKYPEFKNATCHYCILSPGEM
jgi:hypothetical protein